QHLAFTATAQPDTLFFFQAEDGIRDKLVTGVQTCALPICGVRRAAVEDRRLRHRRARGSARAITARDRARRRVAGGRGPGLPERSEERRVGKECGSWWSLEHCG